MLNCHHEEIVFSPHNLHNCNNELNFLLFLGMTPVQNGAKHEETVLNEIGTHKSEGDDNEMKLQTTADVNSFRKVNMPFEKK